MIAEFAPAKVNLALHVTGRRANGYHLLQSIVVFADIGDTLHVEPAETDRLRVEGPFADGVPLGPDNLIWRGADLVAHRPKLSVVLQKNLPPASGIGGGTSDAAAVLRAVCKLQECPEPPLAALMSLGADMPVCCLGKPCRMAGIGEDLAEIRTFPSFHAVLVNPRVELSTPQVFKALDSVSNPPLAPLPQSSSRQDWLAYLAASRNDLAAPAKRLAPNINLAEAALRDAKGCQLARMSGSGATVFGLFDSRGNAQEAARLIALKNPDWWVKKTKLAGSDDP